MRPVLTGRPLEVQAVNTELKLESAPCIEAQVASGRFKTANDDAVALAQLSAIRAEIEAAELEGGEYTPVEVLNSVDVRPDGPFSSSHS